MCALQALTLDQAGLYRIEVQGRIDGGFATWLERTTVEVREEDGVVTAILAHVADQAELHGILQALYTLGLPLLSLARLA